MQEIADKIIFDLEVALVDLADKGQPVHVFEDRAIAVVADRAAGGAVAEAVDRVERAPVGDLLDREVEFFAGDKIESGRRLEAVLGLDRDLGADHADLEPRVGVLERLGDLDVGGEGRGRGVQDAELVIGGERRNVAEPEPRRRRVDEPAFGHQGRRLGEPSRIPERADLAARLIARAGAAIKAVEGRRMQKQGLHHRPFSPSTKVIRPLGSTWKF